MVYMKLRASLLLAGCLSLVSAVPFASQHTNELPLPSKTIFQMDTGDIWLETILARQNGELLVTMLWPNSSIFSLQNPSSPSPEWNLVHTFDGENGVLGIVETKPDIFVVAAGQFTAMGTWVAGTGALWEISLAKSDAPSVRKITDIPESVFLNGVEAVPGCAHDAVLIADSSLGAVWRVDTNTGNYSIVLEVPEMLPIANATEQFGVNGLKVRDGYLYWSNSNYHTIYRVKFDSHGYPVAGAPVETVAVLDSVFIDDFVFDKTGTLWAATNLDNLVVALRPDGSSETVAGAATQLTVAGDTSVTFGTTKSDSHILYVVTTGAVASPVNGTVTEPPKVVAVDTTGFR
ncbi:putative SMP-30/Gluconolactonase/LRE-like region domain-containing protein [Seiridium cardinale]|uniref:SMP-30/Gluconolactonase/LRE-like region domain-containing protein n=1 Tax=Seiridium cardinale TaxID=138064 RepID=A0ABR2XK34_9PEZI